MMRIYCFMCPCMTRTLKTHKLFIKTDSIMAVYFDSTVVNRGEHKSTVQVGCCLQKLNALVV